MFILYAARSALLFQVALAAALAAQVVLYAPR
jgi:hypothetical protein